MLAKKYISEKSLEEALSTLYFEKTNYDIKVQSIKAISGKQTQLIKGIIAVTKTPDECQVGAKTKITIKTDPLTICLDLYKQSR